jgi:hypothetical protein
MLTAPNTVEPWPYITAQELVCRWRGAVTLRTLRWWRRSKDQRGPAWVRIGGAVLYSVLTIEEYEKTHTVNPSSQR